ncbi:I[[h]] channel [Carabus blaptoides fortunei]
MLSNNISHRTVYLKSHWQNEQECVYHLTTHYYIIHPFSAFRYYWELFMIIIFINKLLAFPHIMVLNTEYLPLFMYYILTLQLICIANIVVEFSSGYFDHATNEVVLQPKHIARKYVCTLFFPELLATIPVAHIYYMLKSYEFMSRSLLLLNLFNVFSLMDYLDKIRKKRECDLLIYKTVEHVLIFVFAILWISSSMALAVNYDQGLEFKNIQWMKYVHGSLNLVSNLGQSEITLYGLELLVNVVAVFFGFTMRLLILVQIILMMNSWFSSHRYCDQLRHEMEIYSHLKFLAKSISRRLAEYYNFVFRNDYYNENEIWGHISEKLKIEIEHNLFRSWYESEIFSACSPKIIESITSYIHKETYVSGDEICKIGDVCTCIYFIKIGTISFYNSSQQKVKSLEEGSFFAEDALMFEEDETSLYSVVAIEACEIYKLHRDDFYQILIEYREVYEAVQEKLRTRKHLNANNPLS